MNHKSSSTTQRPSSSNLNKSRQAPLRPTLRFSAQDAATKPQKKDPASQDLLQKPRQQRQINSARVSVERSSFSPAKKNTTRPVAHSSKTQKNNEIMKEPSSNWGASVGIINNKLAPKEKARGITSSLSRKPTSPGGSTAKLQLEANQNSFELSHLGSCSSAKASKCPSGLLLGYNLQDDATPQSNNPYLMRKNSSGFGSSGKSPKFLSYDKLETESITASTDYTKSPKAAANNERKDGKKNNVPGINMTPVKKPKDESYRSAPNSIDRYEFYADNFSLGRTNPRPTQRNVTIEPKITITMASHSATPAAETPGQSILDQFSLNKSQVNSAMTVPTVMASPKLSPIGVMLHKNYLNINNNMETDEELDDKAKSAYLLPKGISDKSINSKKERNNSMIHFKKSEEEKTGSVERTESKEKPRVSSKDRSALIKPGSQSYGKFANVYKGIENRDSWKLSTERFKKLERQSITRLLSERSQEPRKNTELERRNNSREPSFFKGETEQRSVYKPVVGSAINKRDNERSLSKGRASKNEQSMSRYVDNEEKKDENNALGDALTYLSNLKSKGLLDWFKLNKNDTKLYQELELMKKEIDSIKANMGENEHNFRKEELEEKLLLLLDMTLNNLTTVIEKKAKQ